MNQQGCPSRLFKALLIIGSEMKCFLRCSWKATAVYPKNKIPQRRKAVQFWPYRHPWLGVFIDIVHVHLQFHSALLYNKLRFRKKKKKRGRGCLICVCTMFVCSHSSPSGEKTSLSPTQAARFPFWVRKSTCERRGNSGQGHYSFTALATSHMGDTWEWDRERLHLGLNFNAPAPPRKHTHTPALCTQASQHTTAAAHGGTWTGCQRAD